MVFKRRDRPALTTRLREALLPRGGWRRVMQYLGHRVSRLPDTPHRIALGFACGIFVSFTPLFGLHFVMAALCAKIVRGNIIASLIGTLVGNPATFPFIASTSLWLGRQYLGYGATGRDFSRVSDAFAQAAAGIWHSSLALVGPGQSEWARLLPFVRDVFWPYLIGGLLPGLIAAALGYCLTRPLITAYQRRRRTRMIARANARPPRRLRPDFVADGAAGQSYNGTSADEVKNGAGTMSDARTGRLRLGVNIDHVATVRNARGGAHPDPVRAASLAEAAGADGITVHLREDRRHITDGDIDALMAKLTLPLNLEMAATPEMQAIALRHRPHAVCIVPEHREERTTEGGLEVAKDENRLAHFIAPLRDAGIRVSIFIAADRRQIEAVHRIGAPVIELHTGGYNEAGLAGDAAGVDAELQRLTDMATFAHGLGLEVHAGHGLTFENVGPIAALPEVRELNIGHFIVGEAIFVGLEAAVARMRAEMDKARG